MYNSNWKTISLLALVYLGVESLFSYLQPQPVWFKALGAACNVMTGERTGLPALHMVSSLCLDAGEPNQVYIPGLFRR